MAATAATSLTPRPGFGRKCSSVSNLIEAYASARYSNTPSPGTSLPASTSTAIIDTHVTLSPRKDSGFSDTVPWIQERAAVNSGDASSHDVETPSFSPTKAKRNNSRTVHEFEQTPTACADFRSAEYVSSATSGTSAPSRCQSVTSDEAMASSLPPPYHVGQYYPATSTSSASSMASPIRPTMSPRKVKSSRSVESPQRPELPHWPTESSKATRLPHESVLPGTSALRPRSHSRTEQARDQDQMSSPTKKLVRKQSTSRLKAESRKPVHSRSLSLPRHTSSSTLHTTTTISANAAREQLPYSKGFDEVATSMLRHQTLPDSSTSYSDSRAATGENTSPIQPRRKRSLYRRMLQHADDDSNGFPMPSPMTEIVKAMPETEVPKRSGSSGLLSSLTRKLSNSSLGHSHSMASHEAVPPLPTNSDYFGMAVTLPAKDSSVGSSTVPERQDSCKQPHQSSNAASPVRMRQQFIDPFSSSHPAVSSEFSEHQRKSSRSNSAPSPSRPVRSSSVGNGSHRLARAPVPPMPDQVPREHDGVDLVISAQGASALPDAVSRAVTPMSPSKVARSASNGSPAAQESASHLHSGGRTPVARLPRSFDDSRPPPSPNFSRTTRANSASSKSHDLPVSEENTREARFLELLSKSDKSRDGVIKLSLTPRTSLNAV